MMISEQRNFVEIVAAGSAAKEDQVIPWSDLQTQLLSLINEVIYLYSLTARL